MQRGRHARPDAAGGHWPWRRPAKGTPESRSNPADAKNTAPADEMTDAPAPAAAETAPAPGMAGPAAQAPDMAPAPGSAPAGAEESAPAPAAAETAPAPETAGPAAQAPDMAAPAAGPVPPAGAEERAPAPAADAPMAGAPDSPAPGMAGPAAQAPDMAPAPGSAPACAEESAPAPAADAPMAGAPDSPAAETAPAPETAGPAAQAPDMAAPAAGPVPPACAEESAPAPAAAAPMAGAPAGAPAENPAEAETADDRPGLAALRSAFAAAEQEKETAGAKESWTLAPAEKPRTRRMRLAARVGLAAVFLLAVGLAWPGSTSQGGLAVASATPRPTPGPTADLEGVFTLAQGLMPSATPRPTLEPFDIEKFTAEQIAILDEATKKDDKETTYDSAEDYFGSGDVTLDIYYFPENVPMATNPPTAVPTAAPTAAPTATPAPTPTLAPGETPGPTPEATAVPEITPAPTAVPTAAPTAVPAEGPVLQGSGAAACVLAYNAWDDSLKAYTWQTARAYGVSYELVLSIIYHESRFQAGATHVNTNGTTDWGLMQINDVCFSLLNQQMGLGSMSELLDPYKAVQAGCAILAYHLRYTGNEDDALLRYQVGAGNYAYYKANGTVPLCYTNTIALRSQYYAAGI